MTAQTMVTSAPTLHAMTSAVRFLAVDMVEAANSGHPGLPLGMADVATVLWTEHLKFDALDPAWPDRDRFVLSAGHGSALLYALAWLSGLRGVELDHLRSFRQLGSPAAGHPEYGHFPGVETTTGPLGQGIANGVGMAIAEAKTRAEFGAELCDHRTWVVAGDGCLMEGISQEAISLAGHLRLDRLTVFWDDNRITIDGSTDLSTSDDQVRRLEASGWHTLQVDGHDYGAISAAMASAIESDRPTFVACRTIIGKGAPDKAGSHKIHGSPLGSEELAAMKSALDWNLGAFETPDALLDAWRSVGLRGAQVHDGWNMAVIQAGAKGKALRERLRNPVPATALGQLADMRNSLITRSRDEASRVAGRQALEALVPSMPGLLGGSADLSTSNGTRCEAHVSFTAENRTGNFLQYGVREHAMAACMNGIALHGGYVAYGSTFLVFSDYARPAIRLAALMGLSVVHVMTHDSIGVGEDGPTHQPVEHLCALRAIPNLLVIRPADSLETVDAWQVALTQPDRPTLLVLSRQTLESVNRVTHDESTVAKGGYVVAGRGARRVTLLASGSEVSIALEASSMLAEFGVSAFVVSMPCIELFNEQPQDYQDHVLGDVPRVVVEASSGQSWGRYLGRQDHFVGMSGFGASGKATDLFTHFGITAQRVRDESVALLHEVQFQDEGI